MYVSCTLKLLSFHLQICLPQTNLLVCPTKFHFLGPRGPYIDYRAFDFPISFLPPATIFPSLLTKYFPFPNIFLLFLFHSSSPPHKIFSCPLETPLKRVRMPLISFVSIVCICNYLTYSSARLNWPTSNKEALGLGGDPGPASRSPTTRSTMRWKSNSLFYHLRLNT